jgi:hypothetical protein
MSRIKRLREKYMFCCAGSGRELPAARICAGAVVMAVRRERTKGGYA